MTDVNSRNVSMRGWSDIAFATEDEARLAAFDKLPKHFPGFQRRIAEMERADG